MNRICAALCMIAAALFAAPAHAQSDLPTPQTLTGAAIGDQEAKILSGFFNALNEAHETGDPDVTINDIIKDVVDVVAGKSGDDDGDGDAKDDDDEGGGKKAKNKDKKKDKANKGRGNGLPPGLQRQLAATGSLPPGLQRKMEESGSLPKGLVAKGLPADLEAALPKLPDGQSRVIVDDDVLVIEDVTGVIIDALPDVIPPDVVPIIKALPQILNQDG